MPPKDPSRPIMLALLVRSSTARSPPSPTLTCERSSATSSASRRYPASAASGSAASARANPGSVTSRSSTVSKSLIVGLPLIEFRHRYRLRPRLARAAQHGVLDDQPLGPAALLRPVHLQQERPEARMVLAQPTTAEPAAAARRLGAEPTQQGCS